MMMDNVEKIRAFFDHISFVAPKAAIGLLEATMPLVVISNPLRDALMLVLRKSMFNRDVSARMIAIKGFLLLLGELKVEVSAPSNSPVVLFIGAAECRSSLLHTFLTRRWLPTTPVRPPRPSPVTTKRLG